MRRKYVARVACVVNARVCVCIAVEAVVETLVETPQGHAPPV